MQTQNLQISDGKFGSFYRLGPLSHVQQNEQPPPPRVILFILAKYSSNVTRYFPNTSTTYANVDHTTNNTKLQCYKKQKILINCLPGILLYD